MNNKELKIQNLIDEYNYTVEAEILDEIPVELRNNEDFMDYMVNGKSLTITYKGYINSIPGHKVYKIKNIKDAEKVFGTKNHDDIISHIESEIQETIVCGYLHQADDIIDDLDNTIDYLSIDENDKEVISKKRINYISKNLLKLNLLQLIWLDFYVYVEEEELSESERNILNGVVSYLMKELRGGK